MINLNDGVLFVYTLETEAPKGGMANTKLKLYRKFWYEELAMGVNEYYLDKQAQSKVVMRVRIHRDKNISNQNIIVVRDKQYKAGRIVHGFNKKGVPVTDITLERIETVYGYK